MAVSPLPGTPRGRGCPGVREGIPGGALHPPEGLGGASLGHPPRAAHPAGHGWTSSLRNVVKP